MIGRYKGWKEISYKDIPTTWTESKSNLGSFTSLNGQDMMEVMW